LCVLFNVFGVLNYLLMILKEKISVFRSKTIEVFSNTPYQTKRGFNAGDLQCVILVILLNLKKSICETIRWSCFCFVFSSGF
jgi:hypothetical protein